MSEVFVLQHEYEVGGRAETKLIGVYSSRAAAEDAVARLIEQPGFSQYPEGFSIDAYPLDQDHWEEGFTTIVSVLVELQDEGVDVWRPVQAEQLPDGSYRIVTANPEPEHEHWAFPTGSIVRCEERTFDGKPHLVAVALARRLTSGCS
jgi:hypothetical protein